MSFISGTPPMLASSADSDQSAHSADPASVAAALKDIKMAIQATRVLQHQVRFFCHVLHKQDIHYHLENVSASWAVTY